MAAWVKAKLLLLLQRWRKMKVLKEEGIVEALAG
jgi:hypothetical protein